ncbi:hypothetical protein IJZ97_00520 [bacterium]|nr:hypothetical protein [bacterium]
MILFSIIFLIIAATVPLPYGAYMLLRLIVCISSIKEIYDNPKLNSDMTFWLVTLAILYNPIIKIPLGKPLWTIVNILTAGFFIYFLSKKQK